MALTPQMETALNQDGFVQFCALKIVLPAKTLRLLPASAVVIIDGETYTGEDDDYGSWAFASEVTDAVDAEAPTFRFTLFPPSETAAEALRSAALQGSAITYLEGLCDPVTGLAVPDPDEVFIGEWDTAQRMVGADVRSVEVSCVSFLERWFDNGEGLELSAASHRAIWPGEKGCDHMPDLGKPLPWGVGGANSGFKGMRTSDWKWWEGSPMTQDHIRRLLETV